jgi:hypothetical protein
MTVLLIVAVVGLLVVAVATLVSPIAGTRPDAREPGDRGWFEQARRLIDGAARLNELLSEDTQVEGLDDDHLASLTRELRGFCTDAAVLGATAPTMMDARVARSVGLRAQVIADRYERELRLREVYADGPVPPRTDEPGADQDLALHEFELAVGDLREHVELL